MPGGKKTVYHANMTVSRMIWYREYLIMGEANVDRGG